MTSYRDEIVPPDTQESYRAHQPVRCLQCQTSATTCAKGNEMHLRAEKLIQQQIAFKAIRASLEVEKMSLETVPASGGGGQPRVVRLQSTTGDRPPNPPVERVRDQVLELACFVTTHCRAYNVIALDVDISP
jgi:hypothetical protein